MAEGDGPSRQYFYGLRPRWLAANRVYRVYVSGHLIAGGYIAGQLYDERSARVQLSDFYSLLGWFVQRCLAQRQQREAAYDTLDPFGSELLAHDPRNFQVRRSDAVRTRFRRKRSHWTVDNVGVVEVDLVSGATLRLILVLEQDPEAVLRLMRRFDYNIEVVGRSTPRPQRKAPSPASKRRARAVLVAMLLGCGVLFGYLAWAGRQPTAYYFSLAAVNVFLGCQMMVQAVRASTPPPNEQ